MLLDTQATARSLNVAVQVFEASKVDDFDAAFLAMVKERIDGVIVPVNPMFGVQRSRIIEQAMRHKLPEWRGNVGIIRSPIRASILPNRSVIFAGDYGG